jgi:site-specific DNA recombinase
VQAALKSGSEDWSLRASNPSTYLLAGIVVCARCDRHYVGGSARGRNARYRYYTCWSRLRYGRDVCGADRLPADNLEAAVVAALERAYERDDWIAKAVAGSYAKENAAKPDYEKQLSQVDSEIAKTEGNVDRYLLAFENKAMPEKACGKRIETLSEDLAGKRRRRADLVIAIEDAPPDLSPGVDIVSARADVARLFGDHPAELPLQKAILQRLVGGICVESRDDILPTFRVPLCAPVRTVTRMVPTGGLEPPAFSLPSDLWTLANSG